ncbi:MAG TPA: bifunctional oligoribonuclease/PAP phosphatase NrnA [Negativicutes bacterium]|jgi:phosphoesterase RecJ-like protein
MEVSLEQTVKLLEDSNNIVITAHIHPDGDSLGSMLALNQYLLSIGKNVKMLLDDEIPPVYHFLPGNQDIIRPDSPVYADLLIVLDASDVERIAEVKNCVDAPILNIDHHISNTKFAKYWYIDSKSAATGEIILQLLKMMNAIVTLDIAICLYTAIATDCGFFRYANTSANTLRSCATLMECGVQPHVIAEYLETKPLASIMTLTKVLETLEIYHQGQIAIITVMQDILDTTENTEGFINYPRNIEGVEIAIMFKCVSENAVRVSFRSKAVDVSQIALAFGGGGHVRAAGCTVVGRFVEAKGRVIQAAIKHLREME